MSKRLLMLYPHGIGDCILLTPVLRKLHADKKFDSIAIGLDEDRAYDSGVLANCPYVDEVYPIPCPHGYSTYYEGEVKMLNKAQLIMEEGRYNMISNIIHEGRDNKIFINFAAFQYEQVMKEDLRTEVFLSEEDRAFAKEFVGDRRFTFIHGSSPSLPPKDFPTDFLEEIRKDGNVIEVGVDFQPTEFDINKQFAIMELADKIYVIDSAFYHAAHALGKKVDLAYFNRGEGVYNRVRPLHKVTETIKFKI